MKHIGSQTNKGNSPRKRLLAAFFVVLATAQTPGNCQPQPAVENIAKPVDRRDFENRIWKTSESGTGTVRSTQVLRPPEQIYDHIDPCEHQSPCRQNVFVAGTGYLKGHSGPKNSVQIGSPDSPVHIAVLSAFIPAEGLTNAQLAVFNSEDAFPKCQIPIKVPPYDYGSWRLSGVFPAPQDAHVAWLEGHGGDGGGSWSLNVFVTFSANCSIVASQAYYVSAGGYPDTCNARLPPLNSFFTVLANGGVRTRTPPRNCMNVKLTRDQKTVVGK